jgi:uncharacterized membrane protein YjgN (DUF898 family)
MADQEPDYGSYTAGQLMDEACHIDRQEHPERAARLDAEMARRREQIREGFEDSDTEAPVLTDTKPLPLAFHGSAREYFRIWIVNLCLTIVTLGIFSAWAKVRKKRYSYSHTTLGGTPFQYLGQPVPILKGRLIAAAGLLLYYVASHFVTSLLPWVLGAGLVAAPWVVSRSAAFNARYSAFRNMTFHFGGTYWGAARALYMGGIVPALVIVTIFDIPGKLAILGVLYGIFGFSFPWWLRGLKKFVVEGTSFGGKKGAFLATGGQFFKIYFLSSLITSAVALPVTGAVYVIFFVIQNPALNESFDPQVQALALAVAGYAGYAVGYAYNKSRSGNLAWDHTSLGPIRFSSTLRSLDLTKLYVTNALAIVASCGLAIPWAMMRTLRYRADHMFVRQEGDMAEFKGSDRSTVGAVGAEALGFFDLDLSI